MNYVLLIHQGDSPVPGKPSWEALSKDEQTQIWKDYQALNETPGVTTRGHHLRSSRLSAHGRRGGGPA